MARSSGVAAFLKWLPWLLLVGVTVTSGTLLFLMDRMHKEAMPEAWNRPRFGAILHVYETEWKRGEGLRDMGKLEYSGPSWGQLTIGREGQISGRVFCYLEWKEDVLSLRPYLLTDSASIFFCEQGIDPQATFSATLSGDKLTFTGKWAEIQRKPLFRRPDIDMTLP